MRLHQTTSRRLIAARSSDRRGATSVEFAGIAMVLFTLIFTSVEFSRLNLIRNLAQDAAYFAARNSMVPGATADEATAVANEILGYMNTQNASISINNGLGVTTASDEITVTVTVPIADNAFFISSFADNANIVATATMRTERYDGYYNPDT